MQIYELAYLAGGPTRVIQTAIMRARDNGFIDAGSTGKLLRLRAGAAGPEPVDELIASIENVGDAGAFRGLTDHPAIKAIGVSLRARGLLVPDWMQVLILVAITGVGIVLSFATGLVHAMFVGAAIAIYLAILEWKTDLGRLELEAARARDSEEEAVALDGPSCLAPTLAAALGGAVLVASSGESGDGDGGGCCGGCD